MWEWWRIGLCAGLGVAIGVVLTGFLGGTRVGAALAVVLGAAAGIGVGLALDDWNDAVAGALGSVAGAAGAVQVVQGALRRGGTRGGTAILVAGAGIVLAGLAFVPALGVVEALAIPALGARLRRRGGERYAGLRILARD
jgi:hypothetical protein